MAGSLPRKASLHITQPEGSTPSVMLGDLELAGVLTTDGLSIEYVLTDWGSVPQVTMVFGPGSLELDFDVDLLGRLLAEARTKAEQ